MGDSGKLESRGRAKGSSLCLAPDDGGHVGMQIWVLRSYFLRDARWTDSSVHVSVGSDLQAFSLPCLPKFTRPPSPVSVHVSLEAL